MRFRQIAVTVLAIQFVSGTNAWSGELDYSMPSNAYDVINAKLINRGYREVRVIDAENGRLVALDPQGSEVVLIVNAADRQVISSSYIHPSDV